MAGERTADELAEAFAAVEGAVRRALDVAADSADTTDRQLTARLRAADRIARLVEAEVVAVVAEAERSGSYLEDGHVSARNWVMAETNTSLAEARGRAETARLALDCPQVLARLSSGELGVAQARVLGRLRANPRIGADVHHSIDALLDEAARVPHHGFVALVRHWEQLVDADGAHRDHDAAHAGRRVRTRRHDDGSGGEVWGAFGPDQFAEVCEILGRYADTELQVDLDRLRAEHGPAAGAADLARTNDQRWADGFVQALRDAAASATCADAVPTVNYVIAADVFDEQVRALVEQRPADFDVTSVRGRWCMTTTGTPVDPATVVAAALVGHIRRFVIDAASRVIDVGTRQRCFTGAAREAALVQALLDSTNGRCLWPGCGRLRNHQVDHVQVWQHHGVTDLANAALLCARHNRWKSHGYTTYRAASGDWHTYRPDGTELGAAA